MLWSSRSRQRKNRTIGMMGRWRPTTARGCLRQGLSLGQRGKPGRGERRASGALALVCWSQCPWPYLASCSSPATSARDQGRKLELARRGKLRLWASAEYGSGWVSRSGFRGGFEESRGDGRSRLCRA